MPATAIPPYRIKARLQNNRLWRAVIDTWPDVVTQLDAATKLGIKVGTFADLLNMRSWPGRIVEGYSEDRPRSAYPSAIVWRPIAEQVADTLGLPVVYLFDPKLYGQKAVPLILELHAPSMIRELENRKELSPPPTPDAVLEQTQVMESLRKTLDWLNPQQRRVIELRFGFTDGQTHTCEEIAKILGYTRTRISQIEARALRKFRHPHYAKLLHAAEEGILPDYKSPKAPDFTPRDSVLNNARIGKPIHPKQ